MILGAFGDSFLHGSELTDCDTRAWRTSDGTFLAPPFSNRTYPGLIAKKLGIEYSCYALGGIGNRHILDDIICAVTHQGNNMFYIINWSWIDRFDYIDCKTNLWQCLLPSQKSNFSNFYYKNIHSELLDKHNSLTIIYTAIQLLKSNNCKFLMTYMDELLLDKKYHCSTQIDKLQNLISPYLDTFDEMNFLNWSIKNNFLISPTMHPLDQAHEKAADYWLPKVHTLLNTTAKED